MALSTHHPALPPASPGTFSSWLAQVYLLISECWGPAFLHTHCPPWAPKTTQSPPPTSELSTLVKLFYQTKLALTAQSSRGSFEHDGKAIHVCMHHCGQSSTTTAYWRGHWIPRTLGSSCSQPLTLNLCHNVLSLFTFWTTVLSVSLVDGIYLCVCISV